MWPVVFVVAVAFVIADKLNSITGADGIDHPTDGSTTLIRPPSLIPPTLLNDTVLSVVTAGTLFAAVQRNGVPSAPFDMLAIATPVGLSTT